MRAITLSAVTLTFTVALAQAQTPPATKPATPPTPGKPVAPPEVLPGQPGKVGTAPAAPPPLQPVPASTPTPLSKSDPAKYDSASTDPTGDAARLDGLWQAVTLEDGGKPAPGQRVKSFQVRIHKDLVVFNPGPEERVFAFAVDPKVAPKTVDLNLMEGPNKGQLHMSGIYKLERDRLTVCLTKDKDAGKRPAAFKTTSADGYELITLERVKPVKPVK